MMPGRLTALLLSLSLLLAACSSLAQDGPTPGKGPDPHNGERIYFTSISGRGGRITYTGGPFFGGMMGSYLTCAACHGPDARGGLHNMHMEVMEAPDIRYTALSTMHEMESGDNSYSLDEFKISVEEGKHSDGDELDANMPRWSMSDADLEDLFAFLQALP